MNTLGEHLDRAGQQLTACAQEIANHSRIDTERAEALLAQTHQTARALRELLTTTWEPRATALGPTTAYPRADRDSLAAMVTALDQRIDLPAPAGAGVNAYAKTRAVAAALAEVQQAAGILRAHIGPDRVARSPEASTLTQQSARWMLTERIAEVSTALAGVETALAGRWVNPAGTAQLKRSAKLHQAAREAARAPHQVDTRVLSLHEAGHRPLDHSPLSDVAGLLERFCQRIWTRAEAGDLDGVSVRAAATTGVFVTGHLEVIARATQHRATELWTGVLGQIREQQLHRVTAEATTARQAWQQLQTDLRPLMPVGAPDLELTRQATQVRAALEAITRRDDHWRPIEQLVRSRRDAENLVHATATVAPDAETLASLLDHGLAQARSADLCIRADQIPDPQAHVEERIRRKWVPAPPAVLGSVRAAARGAEAATHTMAVSAADTRLSMTLQLPEPVIALTARVAAQTVEAPQHGHQRQQGSRQR